MLNRLTGHLYGNYSGAVVIAGIKSARSTAKTMNLRPARLAEDVSE